jgi:hypothetical protein
LIAAVDDNGRVCLWEVETRQLLSHDESSIGHGGPVSLSFSPKGTQIILSRSDGFVLRWNVTDKTLTAVGSSTSSSSLLLQNDNTLSFDMKKGWQRGSDQSEAALYWFPFEDPDAGLWAYVDGKLIRCDREDSVTIFDVGGDSSNEGRAD